jgi:hypothetical protein
MACHASTMAVMIEGTDEFDQWFNEELTDREREEVIAIVDLLQSIGIALGYPYSSSINSSKHGAMRELRTRSGNEVIRILYIFDPRRVAVLLIGGSKTGDDRWYESYVPRADKLYDDHLRQLRKEGLIK